jgi:hypothetical protein
MGRYVVLVIDDEASSAKPFMRMMVDIVNPHFVRMQGTVGRRLLRVICLDMDVGTIHLGSGRIGRLHVARFAP